MKLLVFAAIITLFFGLRLPNLTLQPIFADEAIYIRWAQVMKAEPTLRFVSLSDGKTPLFMWALIPFFKVFNDPLLAGRFLSVLSGLFTLMGIFFLSKKIFNTRVAYWSSLIYAVTPYVVFFDRMALVDSMLSAFTVWSVYFAIWLAETLRLDLAMILGYLLGGAILVKTPGMINLLVLPVSLLGLKKNNQGQYPMLKALILLAVSVLIAVIIYNLLRLGPGFQQLSSRNADYVFSPFELMGRPMDPFLPHFHDISDWFPKLLTIPILILFFFGIYFSILKFKKRAAIIFIWALIPLLLNMAFLKTFTARYLLPSIPIFLIFAGFGLAGLLEKVRLKKFEIAIALIVILPLALQFDYQLIKNPPPDNLPGEERKGYFEDWTAGYGFKDMADYILEQSRGKRVVLGTEGFFGTLPDGIQIYLDKANVAIAGSTATISAQIRNAAKENLTYFVGNKKDLEGALGDVVLIKEYAKAKPKDKNIPQDASVLYQVLPQ